MDSDLSDEEMPPAHIIEQVKNNISSDVLNSQNNAYLGNQSFTVNFEKRQKKFEEMAVLREEDIMNMSLANRILESDDEDIEISELSFDELGQKMENVTPDGKIKKLVKRKGEGPNPPEGSTVYIHYCSYLESHDDPVDCAYIRKPFNFRLGCAVVRGMNNAVETMQINEKSLFLIHYDYAFGEMGHPPRIPPKSTFLFHIELLRFVDSGLAYEYHNLTQEEKKQFPISYKTALGLVETAREHFKYNSRLAIRDYNRAAVLMEDCHMEDASEEEKQQKLLLKLYTNLAVCYTKNGHPKKACNMCNNIYKMTKNTSLKVPPKVYFHNGRALVMLGDYQRAKQQFFKAKALEPQNQEISKELSKLDVKIQEELKRERHFAQVAFNVNKKEDKPEESATEEKFQAEMKIICEEFIGMTEKTRFRLPYGLTDQELECAKIEAKKHDLAFISFKDEENDGKIFHYITKK